MFCHKCGNQLPEDSEFCRKCGAKLIVDGSSQQTHSALTPTPIPVAPTSAAMVATVKMESTSSEAKRKSKKLAFGIIGAAVIAVIAIVVALSCGNKALSGGNNKYVQLVKNGTLNNYQQMTIGEAYDRFLSNAKWESGVSEEGQRFVNVRGNALYLEKNVEIVVQYFLDENNGTIEYNAMEFNGVPQSNFMYWALLEKMYDSDSLSRTYTNDEGQSNIPSMSKKQTSMDVYFIQNTERGEPINDGFQPVIVLHPDGNFTFRVNLYASLGFIYGTYRLNNNTYTFYVKERDFRGFIGDDVEVFLMALDGDRLIYRTDDWIGATHPGQIFYRTERVDFTPYTTFPATHKVATNDGSNLRLRDAPSFSSTQISSLEYGSSVKALEIGVSAVDSDGNRGNWTYITTQDGRTGWCFGAYLQPLQ